MVDHLYEANKAVADEVEAARVALNAAIRKAADVALDVDANVMMINRLPFSYPMVFVKVMMPLSGGDA